MQNLICYFYFFNILELLPVLLSEEHLFSQQNTENPEKKVNDNILINMET